LVEERTATFGTGGRRGRLVFPCDLAGAIGHAGRLLEHAVRLLSPVGR
jgi:hypothetical protein